MKRNSRNGGLTLLESLIVVAIIAMLAVMLYPVFGNLKMRMKVVGTIQRLHQFNTALQIYRQEWNGADVFDSWRSFTVIGLPAASANDPTWMHLTPPLPGISQKDWIGPCGYDVDRNPSAGPGNWFELRYSYPRHAGCISYAAAMYAPIVMENEKEWSNYGVYKNYIRTYRDQIIVFAEFYCNPATVAIDPAWTKKRGIGLRLSGQAVVREDVGTPVFLHWFEGERPPD
ncbi:MAG: hypothetical protein KatS3mg015_2361 [Fimbriimonadales bacterium]|nr:MAG: hypothetical protein KatS3mg015_2361 [Fimbriimonadales bacterium]